MGVKIRPQVLIVREIIQADVAGNTRIGMMAMRETVSEGCQDSDPRMSQRGLLMRSVDRKKSAEEVRVYGEEKEAFRVCCIAWERVKAARVALRIAMPEAEEAVSRELDAALSASVSAGVVHRTAWWAAENYGREHGLGSWVPR